jgi:hypothetical protein
VVENGKENPGRVSALGALAVRGFHKASGEKRRSHASFVPHVPPERNQAAAKESNHVDVEEEEDRR